MAWLLSLLSLLLLSEGLGVLSWVWRLSAEYLLYCMVH
jgi:hypothetical protein